MRALPVTRVHGIKSLVDLVEVELVRNKLIDLELALLVLLDEPTHLGATLDTAKRGALPDATGHQLERTSADLLTGASDTDDNGLSPALVAGFEGRAHDVHVTGAVKGVVETTVGHVDQDLLDRLVVILWVDKISRAKLARYLFLFGVDIDRNNAACTVVSRALSDAQTYTAHAKDGDLVTTGGFRSGLIRESSRVKHSDCFYLFFLLFLTEEPLVTLAVRVAAPKPVVTPQPKRHSFWRLGLGSTFTTETSATTDVEEEYRVRR